MKIYIDLTYYLSVSFVSGIQRVVREVTGRLMKADGIEVVLLQRRDPDVCFHTVRLSDDLKKPMNPDGKPIGIGEMERGGVWLDIDSVWPVLPKRSILYPALHNQGLTIVPMIQDILPILHPKYFAGKGDWNFLGYLYAVAAYADMILTSAEATRDTILQLMKQVGARNIPVFATQLGGNLPSEAYDLQKVDSKAVRFVENNPKYLLMVGTIEPRKNHKVILKAFQEGKLFDEGIGLVFAGRYGWSADDLLDQIHSLASSQKRFTFLEGKNNETIRFLYEHARVVAFPSFEEGYGLPIAEALTYGVPVIAGDRPVLREVGGSYCRYCSVEDSTEWADAIREVFSDDKGYRQWKKQIEMYQPTDWDTVTERIISCLQGRNGD